MQQRSPVATCAACTLEQMAGSERDMYVVAFANVWRLIGAKLHDLSGNIEIDDRRVAEFLEQVNTRRQARRCDAECGGTHAERDRTFRTERTIEVQVDASHPKRTRANLGRQQVHCR